MRSRIQLRMLLCVTQAAKKLQENSFFSGETREKPECQLAHRSCSVL
jgi:hypothetical protein